MTGRLSANTKESSRWDERAGFFEDEKTSQLMDCDFGMADAPDNVIGIGKHPPMRPIQVGKHDET